VSDEIEISEERIRRFAEEGGLEATAVDHFLNTPCYSLQMQNLDSEVLLAMVGDLTACGLVVSCEQTEPAKFSLHAWVPSDLAQGIVAKISAAYKAVGKESPYEHYDFQGMDDAMEGRGYIKAMLIGAAGEGQDIS
jgi:hypothetical protein